MRSTLHGPRRILLVLVVLSSVAVLGAASGRPKPPCEIAHDWAVGQATSHRLPTTLPEFSQYSLPFRRAIYSELTADQRIALWREHLTSFLGATSPLNAEQQATVRFTIDQLDRYLHLEPEQARAALKHDGLTAATLTAQFGDSLGRIVFGILGDDRTNGITPVAPAHLYRVSFTDHVVQWLHATNFGSSASIEGAPTATATTAVLCDCSYTNALCGAADCIYRMENCQIVYPWPGCGTLWLFDCDGLCNLAQ
jgi:hypothetical protein